LAAEATKMWATAETWIQKIQTMLKTEPPSDEYPNDRLPSEQVIGHYALRGYRGPEALVSSRKYFDSLRIDGFVQRHEADMRARKWPVSKQYVERDVLQLEQLAEECDAVRVVPTR
jgi:hypothetical protein